jgi:hypothetical protein
MEPNTLTGRFIIQANINKNDARWLPMVTTTFSIYSCNLGNDLRTR